MASNKSYTFESILPWASSKVEDRRFIVLAALFVLSFVMFSYLANEVELPEKTREELEKLPPSLVQVVEEKKKEPPKPPPPKPKTEEVKRKDSSLKKPTTVERQKARKVANEKIEQVRNQVESLRESFADINSSLSQTFSTTSGLDAVSVSRSMLTGDVTSSSGGIGSASVGGSGIGGGSIAGPGRQAASVTGGGIASASQVKKAKQAKSSSSRTEGAVRSKLDAYKSQLYRIYQRALRDNPGLRGKVVFEIVIQPTGKVKRVRIVRSSLRDKALERKLVMKVRSIDFGAVSTGGELKTRWAVDFSS